MATGYVTNAKTGEHIKMEVNWATSEDIKYLSEDKKWQRAENENQTSRRKYNWSYWGKEYPVRVLKDPDGNILGACAISKYDEEKTAYIQMITCINPDLVNDGVILVYDAIEVSKEWGYKGRVMATPGTNPYTREMSNPSALVFSDPSARKFFSGIGMEEIPSDHEYGYQLRYEFDEEGADEFCNRYDMWNEMLRTHLYSFCLHSDRYDDYTDDS
jgi:hypothetical protein